MARTSAAKGGRLDRMAAEMARPSGSAAAVSASDTRDRLAMMSSVAAKIDGYRPAREVLTSVRGVRTIFPQIDAITRIGAWPIERVALVHGPSNHGKTEFCLGLGKSFLEAGHFFKLVDAEFSTPLDWLAQLGLPIDHPGFSALRPSTYEQTVDAVQAWAEGIGNAKAIGELPPDTTGLVVVDSLKKLTPKNLLQKLLKEDADAEEKKQDGRRRRPSRGFDGMGGRGAQFKAALNNQWMDQLVPLMAQTGTAIALIAREYEKSDDDDFLTRDEDYVIGGGRGPVFDSSVRARVILEGEVWDDPKASSRRTYGQRHRVEIRKTKIGKKDVRVPSGLFHSSNGEFVPEGFDTPRDYLDLAKDMGLVDVRGSHHWHGKTRLGNGEHAAVLRLHKDPKAMQALVDDVRGMIESKIASERAARGLA